MASINVITALKLIRYNTDPEVATILQATIEELDRLQELERYAIALATAALGEPGVIDRQAAWAVKKLVKE